jgi:predicted RNA-binding protein YlqC (UPF0109 family)
MDEKGLVELIVTHLVDHPKEVSLSCIQGEKSDILELRVHPSDVGKVIGKGGRIVTAIRSLLHAMSRKAQKRVMLEVIE